MGLFCPSQLGPLCPPQVLGAQWLCIYHRVLVRSTVDAVIMNVTSWWNWRRHTSALKSESQWPLLPRDVSASGLSLFNVSLSWGDRIKWPLFNHGGKTILSCMLLIILWGWTEYWKWAGGVLDEKFDDNEQSLICISSKSYLMGINWKDIFSGKNMGRDYLRAVQSAWLSVCPVPHECTETRGHEIFVCPHHEFRLKLEKLK